MAKLCAQWKDGELGYCADLIGFRGDGNVGRDPATIAAYLRLQASAAFQDGHMELSARLSEAATAINCDARNTHAPDWDRALKALDL